MMGDLQKVCMRNVLRHQKLQHKGVHGIWGFGDCQLKIQGVEFMPASVARSSTCDGRRKE